MARVIASGTYTEPVCPMCGNNAGTVKYEYPDVKIIRCESCALWRTCPRLSLEKLTEYYEQQYYSESREGAGRYEAWRDANRDVWSTSARLVKAEAAQRGFGNDRPLRLLDVGSGCGFFLEQCLELGIDGRGLEVSPHAVRYSTQTLKLNVRELLLDDLPGDESYDIITLNQVLEHVPDPLATMKQVWQHLVPGGMTWVATPNTSALERFRHGASYFNFLNKSHLTHFHRGTLKALLEKAGFRSVRRYVHWGGGTRTGAAALAQYAARWLCLGTELRFLAEKY